MFAFLHIPKTGGTSLSWALEQHHKLLRLNNWDDIRAFIERKGWTEDWTASTGHMPFGIDAYYPYVRYTIMLRDPIDRVMSDYYYIRRRPDHELYEISIKPLREFPGGNSQTRRLAGWRWGEMFERPDFWWQKYPWGYCTDEMLETAKENLRRCEHVGMYETYAEDASRILSLAGITNLELPRMNVTKARPQVADLDAETLALMKDRNSYDLELCDFARKLRNN